MLSTGIHLLKLLSYSWFPMNVTHQSRNHSGHDHWIPPFGHSDPTLLQQKQTRFQDILFKLMKESGSNDNNNNRSNIHKNNQNLISILIAAINKNAKANNSNCKTSHRGSIIKITFNNKSMNKQENRKRSNHNCKADKQTEWNRLFM